MSEKKILHEGRFLSLMINGHWEYVERRNIVGVCAAVAVTDGNEIVLISQFNPVHQKHSIELPAGICGDVDPKEKLSASIARELLEETGYKATGLRYLAKAATSAGLSNEVVHLYRAMGLEKIDDGGGVGAENMNVHLVPLGKAQDWLLERIAEGSIVDMKIYAALYFANKRVVDEEAAHWAALGKKARQRARREDA